MYLFTNKSKIHNLFSKNSLKKIKIIDENKINIFLTELSSKKIILDRLSCCLAFEEIIKNKINVSGRNDPIYDLKTIKNKIEIKNFIKSHILDGVAVIKFLYWINNLKKNISELNAEKN